MTDPGGASEIRQVKTVCPRDCPDVCGMIASVSGSKVVKVKADPEHPITRGFLCIKCRNYENWINHPSRLLHPLVRDRKSDDFRQASWDEALSLIADRFREISDSVGPQAILPYSYLANMGVVANQFPDRLWNKLNTSRVGLEICAVAGAEAMVRILGRVRGTEPQHLEKTRLYVAWGKNPKESNVHLWSMLSDVETTVVVDPFKSRSAAAADLHIQPKPGTDAILVSGILKVMIEKDWIDQAFIDDYTVNYAELEAQVRAVSLAEVERVTGVPRSQIEEFAELYHRHQPGLLHIGVGLQRNLNGGAMVAAVCMLGALSGQIGTKGGGVLYANYDWQLNDISYADLRTQVPRMYNMVKLGRNLTRSDEIRALYVYNQNPAATCPNQNRVRQGLMREDLFVVVHDLFLTDTAQLANVVLPATSFAETFDLQLSYWHDYVQVSNQVIEPIGEARSNHWVIQQLARKLGFTEPCFQQTGEEVIREALAGTGLDYDELRKGPVLWNDIDRTSFDDRKFPTASGKIELFAFDTTLPDADEHEFRFITPKTYLMQASQYGNMPEKLGELKQPWFYIHPDDAGRLDIEEDMELELWNRRGAVKMRARISELTQPGLLVSYMVRWGANANATTPDAEADMGGNSTFHSNYVSIRRTPAGL